MVTRRSELGVASSSRPGSAALARGLVAGLLVLLGSSRALAGVPGGAAVYSVASECPSREVWRERLRARLPAQAATSEAIDGVPVQIQRGASGGGDRGYRGSLGAASDGEPGRAVWGRSCNEVFDALVLMAALSLEAEASESAGSGRPRGDTLDSITENADLEDGPQAAATRQSPEAQGEVTPRWGPLGFALVQTGIAPKASLELGVGVVASWPSTRLEPSLLLGVYGGSPSQTVRVEGARARFEHWAARAIGCPWRYPRESWVALRPCLGFDIGRSRGEGLGVTGASARSSLWLSLIGEVRLEFSLLEHVQLGLAGGVGVPLIRSRFYFEPGILAHRTPPFGLQANSFAAVLF